MTAQDVTDFTIVDRTQDPGFYQRFLLDRGERPPGDRREQGPHPRRAAPRPGAARCWTWAAASATTCSRSSARVAPSGAVVPGPTCRRGDDRGGAAARPPRAARVLPGRRRARPALRRRRLRRGADRAPAHARARRSARRRGEWLASPRPWRAGLRVRLRLGHHGHRQPAPRRHPRGGALLLGPHEERLDRPAALAALPRERPRRREHDGAGALRRPSPSSSCSLWAATSRAWQRAAPSRAPSSMPGRPASQRPTRPGTSSRGSRRSSSPARAPLASTHLPPGCPCKVGCARAFSTTDGCAACDRRGRRHLRPLTGPAAPKEAIMHRALRIALLAVVAALGSWLFAAPARADGLLVARAPNGDDRGAFPLTRTEVRAEIQGQVVSTSVTQQLQETSSASASRPMTIPLPAARRLGRRRHGDAYRRSRGARGHQEARRGPGHVPRAPVTPAAARRCSSRSGPTCSRCPSPTSIPARPVEVRLHYFQTWRTTITAPTRWPSR